MGVIESKGPKNDILFKNVVGTILLLNNFCNLTAPERLHLAAIFMNAPLKVILAMHGFGNPYVPLTKTNKCFN